MCPSAVRCWLIKGFPKVSTQLWPLLMGGYPLHQENVLYLFLSLQLPVPDLVQFLQPFYRANVPQHQLLHYPKHDKLQHHGTRTTFQLRDNLSIL